MEILELLGYTADEATRLVSAGVVAGQKGKPS
jgi:hypothetical protein